LTAKAVDVQFAEGLSEKYLKMWSCWVLSVSRMWITAHTGYADCSILSQAKRKCPWKMWYWS